MSGYDRFVDVAVRVGPWVAGGAAALFVGAIVCISVYAVRAGAPDDTVGTTQTVRGPLWWAHPMLLFRRWRWGTGITRAHVVASTQMEISNEALAAGRVTPGQRMVVAGIVLMAIAIGVGLIGAGLSFLRDTPFVMIFAVVADYYVVVNLRNMRRDYLEARAKASRRRHGPGGAAP
jgi:hypothetical protein